MMYRHFDSTHVEDEVFVEANFGWLNDCANYNGTEKDIYFYHKDHLGSSTQITDKDATVIHHIEYMPSGEQFVEQRSTWGTSYKFNGKELDAETGLYYYGARYYTPEIGIWLSVDPLSDKYPSMSAYMYCAGNQVRYIDPNGMEIGDYYNEWGGYLGTDGIDDKKVYVVNSGYELNYNAPYQASSMVSTQQDYNSSMDGVNYIGTKNEFGLIQLTGMGQQCIQNNDAGEDSYSYMKKDGTYSTKGKHGDDWVTPSTGAAFYGAVKRSGANVVVNDASAYNPSYNLGHKSHKKGTDIDFRYITENDIGSSNVKNLSLINKSLNNNFVKELRASGFTKIFSDGSIQGTIRDNSGIHDNHIHAGR